MADINQRITNLRERIKESDGISSESATLDVEIRKANSSQTIEFEDGDREALLRFSDELRFKQSEYSDHRHVKLLQHCTVLAGGGEEVSSGDLPDHRLIDCLESKEAVREFVRWIHRNYENPETNRDYRGALRQFGEHVTDGDGKPEPITEVSATTANSYDPKPDPNKMFKWEEHILPMIDAAHQTRDKALIALAWDAGGRSGEIRSIKVGDIGDHDHGMSVTLDGKTGQRSVVLIPSVPYVRQWLSEHPRRNDPEAPLFGSISDGSDISYQMKLKILKRAGRNADVTLPAKPTFTRMRKSSASYLAAQNVSQVHLENHHGWERGSDVAGRYIAVFSEETDREVARAHGADIETEAESSPTAPISCPRCGCDTPQSEPLCVHCGQALDPEAASEIEAQDERLFESAIKAETQEAEALETMRDMLEENPEVRSMLLPENG